MFLKGWPCSAGLLSPGVNPGVPAASVGRVFEPFFTTKPVNQGTGLGLAVSLGIAQAHEGSLALVPSDAGACFVLTLPGQRTYVPTAVEGATT